jgi:glycosyltransferase involved in cell wall biosynthesis
LLQGYSFNCFLNIRILQPIPLVGHNGRFGTDIAPPYDKEQLQAALQHILSDDKVRRQFGEKGKLLVRERFSWEKIAQQVESIYKDVLQ